ncbi:MAG: hypothetical protein DMF18_07440 [Verrucomicrobia bacterium]|nr:MAG: hypothetical protein DMF18_07440 [Verrucomicrobiota bacterium]
MFVLWPGVDLHGADFVEQRAHVLRPFRYFCGRKVGQPIVPGMEAGVAARDGIVLVPPVVVIVR